MKKILSLFVYMMVSLCMCAQNDIENRKLQSVLNDSVFNTYIYNDEFKVYLDIDLYGEKIKVPGQEVFGLVPGYFGAVRDSRKWLVTSAKFLGKDKVQLEIVNDYGSEDLTAMLVYDAVGKFYVLKQTSGSRLKIVVNRKWVKIPTELVLTPHKRMANDW